jgi:hypothetical protein
MRKEYDFSKAKRGPVIFPDPKKTRITIRLDTKILKWFWQRVDDAGGGNYQTMINEVLKRYIENEDKKTIRYPGGPRGPYVELDDKFQSECEAEGLEFEVRFYDLEKHTRELRFDRKKAA